MSERPFSGLRVLDLTHMLAGPFCTYQLALLGADVLKIEPPDEPDVVRQRGVDEGLNAQLYGTNFLAQGSNKRAISLNLKALAGRAVFFQLVEKADVLVENYRAGALGALGLGYAAVTERNPRLVYCSLTGYGQGEPRGEANAYDNVVQAASGLMDMTGTESSGPLRVGASIVDYHAGMTAAFAITAALLRRERTGQGTHVDCAMLDSTLSLMSTQTVAAYAGCPPPQRKGNLQPEAGLGCYETAEGLLMLGAFNARQHRRLWHALGRPDFARLASFAQMAAHAAELRAELSQRLLSKTAAEWEVFFHTLGVPAERVRNISEALDLVREQHRPFTACLPVSACGHPVQVPLAPFQFSHGGPQFDFPPPRVGEHTQAVLEELGYTPEEIAALKEQGVI